MHDGARTAALSMVVGIRSTKAKTAPPQGCFLLRTRRHTSSHSGRISRFRVTEEGRGEGRGILLPEIEIGFLIATISPISPFAADTRPLTRRHLSTHVGLSPFAHRSTLAWPVLRLGDHLCSPSSTSTTTERQMTTSTSHIQSRNDIFSTSWSSSDSLVPAPPAQPAGDLIRRRTTGAAWRRPRTVPPRADSIFPSPEPAPEIHFTQHTAGSVREPPELRLRIEPADTDITPSPQSSRTSSFFDVSPSTGLPSARPPASPYSTQSISTTSLTGTSSSTNPSLAASLPSPPPTRPLTPIQLHFAPRPELKLGQGRFSQVYLAACREIGVPEGGGWRVCVVKRLEADEDSQALGLREAWFLKQLRAGGILGADGDKRGKEYITRLLGVEVEEKEASLHVASRLGSITNRSSLPL